MVLLQGIISIVVAASFISNLTLSILAFLCGMASVFFYIREHNYLVLPELGMIISSWTLVVYYMYWVAY